MWFEVDTGELARARGAVGACAAQVAADVDQLGRHLAELGASWQGEAAGAFEAVMTRWEAVHEQVRSALGDVGYALEVTGRAYDEAEGSARGLFEE
jgi:WXG100 family type VII secretion target